MVDNWKYFPPKGTTFFFYSPMKLICFILIAILTINKEDWTYFVAEFLFIYKMLLQKNRKLSGNI